MSTDLTRIEQTLLEQSQKEAKELAQAHEAFSKAIEKDVQAARDEAKAWKMLQNAANTENKMLHSMIKAEQEHRIATVDERKADADVHRARNERELWKSEIAKNRQKVNEIKQHNNVQEIGRSERLRIVKTPPGSYPASPVSPRSPISPTTPGSPTSPVNAKGAKPFP